MLCSITQQKENKGALGAQQKVKELEKQLNEQRVASARRESFLKTQLKAGARDTIAFPWLQMVCRSQLQRSVFAVPLPWTEILWDGSQPEYCAFFLADCHFLLSLSSSGFAVTAISTCMWQKHACPLSNDMHMCGTTY